MTRNFAALAAVLVVASLAAGPGLAGAQTEVTLTITVVDDGGTPVGDVEVTASWDGGSTSSTTVSNGQVLLDVPEDATVDLDVDDGRYVRNTPLTLENADGQDVELGVSTSGSVDVQVVGPDGAVGNSIVQLYHEGTFVVNQRTDADGQLQTDDIETGTYTATVWKRGYLKNRTTIQVTGDQSETVRIEPGSRLVEITVRDDHFSPPEPVENATVEIAGSTVTSFSNGEASVRVPVNAEHELTVSKDGYEGTTTTLNVAESTISRNVSIQRTPGLNLSTANDRIVVGETVRIDLTDEYGDPVNGADIALDGETVGQTDASGSLDVLVESDGTHDLTASSEGLSASATVEGIDPSDDPTVTATAADGATPTATSTDTPTPANSPGFTVLVAVVGLLGAGLLLRRRR
jgi:PGF-CTERM protein